MGSLKWYRNPEMIIASSALFIGLVTAFTSIYSAYVDREYARAAVWPRLEIHRSFGPDSFSYSVSNSGTGPALIKYAKIKHNSVFIKRWSDLNVVENITQSHLGNRTLSPQNMITPLSYKGDKAKVLLRVDESIKIELCYCSIYDECWLVDRNNRPISIDSCVVRENEIFLQ